MCGIFACLSEQPISAERVAHLRQLSSRMRHRGPDEHDWRVVTMQNGQHVFLAHERLMIIDLKTGKQPIQGCEPDSYVVHNGEIYNHMALREVYKAKGHEMHTTCDSEVIVHLAEELAKDCKDKQTEEDSIAQLCETLDGVFAFCVVLKDKFIAARDPIGVKPLYIGQSPSGDWFLSSEMKCLIDECPNSLQAFPPGHYFTKESGLRPYYNPVWFDPEMSVDEVDLNRLQNALIDATEKRLMTDVPLGVLLSGGLDSSLTASIAARAIARGRVDIHSSTLHSFTIALDCNAPDAVAARQVAALIGTDHHEVHFTVDEGVECIERMVYHLETYDVTTVRAGIPMYLLAKYIREMGIKVLLSGEGADEVFGGYLYFHNAPSDAEFTKETLRRVRLLSTADCLRADKSTMAHALEVRVPFLDRHFLDVAMSIAGRHRAPNGGIEKRILREAFDDKCHPWLPESVLWRQKEQFSDGVGYNWIDKIVAHCAAQVTDEELHAAMHDFPINPPTTKEAVFIRKTFVKHFGAGEQAARTVVPWAPKWQVNKDPSGRACKAHLKTKATTTAEVAIKETVRPVALESTLIEDKTRPLSPDRHI